MMSDFGLGFQKIGISWHGHGRSRHRFKVKPGIGSCDTQFLRPDRERRHGLIVGGTEQTDMQYSTRLEETRYNMTEFVCCSLLK